MSGLVELVGTVCKIEYAESAPHQFRYSGGNWQAAFVMAVDQ